MRVRLLLLAVLVVTGFSIAACPSGRSQSLVVKPVDTVKVTVTCSATSDSVWVKVDPWEAQVKKKTDLTWEITSASIADTITITAKNPGDWPYVAAPPYGGKKGGKKAKGSNMKGGLSEGSTFGYNIETTCQNGSGPQHKLVIDPELIIVN
jgi:hypothetical protein